MNRSSPSSIASSLSGGATLRRFALFEAIAAVHPRVPWHEWPRRLARARRARYRRFCGRTCAPGTFRPVPAMACGPSIRGRRTPRARARPRARVLSRSRRRRRAGRRRGVGESVRRRARRGHRRSAGSVLDGRPELEPPAAESRGAPRVRVRRVWRSRRRQHAARRRIADRSRDGAVAAVLDSRRRGGGRRRVRPSIRSTRCWRCWRSRARAPAVSWSARIWGQCPRASASAWRRSTSFPTGCSGSSARTPVSSLPPATPRKRWRASRRTICRRSPAGGPARTSPRSTRSACWRRMTPPTRRPNAVPPSMRWPRRSTEAGVAEGSSDRHRRAARCRDHGGDSSLRLRLGFGGGAAPGR